MGSVKTAEERDRKDSSAAVARMGANRSRDRDGWVTAVWAPRAGVRDGAGAEKGCPGALENLPENRESGREFMERAARVELATSSLGSWHSTTELRPLSEPKLSRTRPRISTALEISMTRAICDATARDCEATALDCGATVLAAAFQPWSDPQHRLGSGLACATAALRCSALGYRVRFVRVSKKSGE
jgi:hypothetical protein